MAPPPPPTTAHYNGTLQWHPAMAPRPLPQSWSSPSPSTLPLNHSTLQWHPTMAPSNGTTSTAPCNGTLVPRPIRQSGSSPSPLLEVRTPIAIAIWGKRLWSDLWNVSSDGSTQNFRVAPCWSKYHWMHFFSSLPPTFKGRCTKHVEKCQQKTLNFENFTTFRSHFETFRSFLPMVVWRIDGNWARRATPRKNTTAEIHTISPLQVRKVLQADVEKNSDAFKKRNDSYMTPLSSSCLLPGHSFLWQRCKVGQGLKNGVQEIEDNEFV